jgi:Centromere DNA-binding protein complex CBF3 subunit, domain 2
VLIRCTRILALVPIFLHWRDGPAAGLHQNEDWFDIKVLVDLHNFASTKTKGISDTTYTREIKKALKENTLPHKHLLHFGRREGAVDLECKQLDHEDIRRLGNWDPTIQEKAYSAKIPISAILCAGNFTEGGGIYFNPRTVVIPSQELQDMIFAFVDPALEAVEAANRDGAEFWTALGFLRFMKRMKQVVLQDAAYMMEFLPDRVNHPVFFEIIVFHTDEFQAFRRLMRSSVEAAVSLVDTQIDTVLPGVIELIRANQHNQ